MKTSGPTKSAYTSMQMSGPMKSKYTTMSTDDSIKNRMRKCVISMVPKLSDAWTKFRLLTWKNCLQQRRHRVQTAVEVLLPVITMALLQLLRWQIEPYFAETKHFPPIDAHSLKSAEPVLYGMNRSDMRLAYSPRNEILESVLTNALRNVFVRNSELLKQFKPDSAIADKLPVLRRMDKDEIMKLLEMLKQMGISGKVDAYDNSAQLNKVYADEKYTRTVIAAVEFPDELSTATVLPKHLSFSLRFPERPRFNAFYSLGSPTWRTDAVFPHFTTPGPRFPFSWEGGYDPGYIYEMFICLQHSISMELIIKKTGQIILNLYDVYVNRYPYPDQMIDPAMSTLSILIPMFILVSFSYTAVNIITAVTVEKEMQLKETMKVMGLPSWLHWSAWFVKQFMFLLFAAVFIVIGLKIPIFTTNNGYRGHAIFTNTPWTVLLFFLLLYIACMCWVLVIS